MPRVRELTLDNLRIKISPLSMNEVEVYIKQSKDMIERNAPPEEWTKRIVSTIAMAMNKAAGNEEMTGEKVATEFDMVTVQELHAEILKMTGLTTKVPTPGEAPATSTLP